MNTKEFAQLAIKNGYTGHECKGWNWIEQNIHHLNYIFETEEYKKCDCRKSLCMALLLKEGGYTELEEDALTTAWYLNNQRQYERNDQEYKEKMLAQSFAELTTELVKKAFYLRKKLVVTFRSECIFPIADIETVYKPFITNDGRCFLMKPKAHKKGIRIPEYGFKKIFAKII